MTEKEVSNKEASTQNESAELKDNNLNTDNMSEPNVFQFENVEDFIASVEEKQMADIEKILDTKSELETLQEKYNELNTKHLRLYADFDNYRKRTLKERMDLIKNGGEDVLKNLLPVVDNFERALKVVNDAKDLDAVKVGIELIYTNFKDFLKQNGVKEVEAMEKEFDTDLHEAITKIPAPKPELQGKVVDVIQKGYYLHDKVVRYAKVVVGE